MKTGTYAEYMTDKQMEQSGVWYEPTPGAGKYLIARAGGANSTYALTVERLSRKHRRAIRRDRLPQEKLNEIVLEAFVDSCLLNWEEATGPDGQPLAFSKPAAKQLLSDLPDLLEDLLSFALAPIGYRAEFRTEEAGNS